MKSLVIFLLVFIISGYAENVSPKQISIIKGDSFQINCNQNNVSITYCWVLGPDKKMYSAIPGVNYENYKYIGEGLEFGHCGIRIESANMSDNGRWRCNVGNGNEMDPHVIFNVNVHETPLAAKKKNIGWAEGIVECQILDKSPVKYCRYIRPDGKGIRPSNTSYYYHNGRTNMTEGLCQLNLLRPTTTDIGKWTCLAKTFNSSSEYFDTIEVENYYYVVIYSSGLVAFGWIVFIMLMCVMTILLMKTKKRRRVAVVENARRPSTSSLPPYSPPVRQNDEEKIPLP